MLADTLSPPSLWSSKKKEQFAEGWGDRWVANITPASVRSFFIRFVLLLCRAHASKVTGTIDAECESHIKVMEGGQRLLRPTAGRWEPWKRLSKFLPIRSRWARRAVPDLKSQRAHWAFPQAPLVEHHPRKGDAKEKTKFHNLEISPSKTFRYGWILKPKYISYH